MNARARARPRPERPCRPARLVQVEKCDSAENEQKREIRRIDNKPLPQARLAITEEEKSAERIGRWRASESNKIGVESLRGLALFVRAGWCKVLPGQSRS